MLEQTGSTGAENTSSSSTALPAALPSLMSLGSNEDLSKGEDKQIKKALANQSKNKIKIAGDKLEEIKCLKDEVSTKDDLPLACSRSSTVNLKPESLNFHLSLVTCLVRLVPILVVPPGHL